MKTLWKETRKVRLWSLWNVFLLWFVKPSVLELSEQRAVIRIPLSWRTRRRDIHAMYFGTLCMGADMAGGLISFYTVQKRALNISFIFKDFKCQFLKRAEGDVHFTNDDGPVVQELIERTLSTGERQEAIMHVTATVPTKLGAEPVAKFELTLSLKKR